MHRNSSPRIVSLRLLAVSTLLFRTGVGAQILGGGGNGLALDEWTIPRVLDAHPALGYAHAAIGKWHLGTDALGGDEHPNLVGFSHFAAIPDGVRVDGVSLLPLLCNFESRDLLARPLSAEEDAAHRALGAAMDTLLAP